MEIEDAIYYIEDIKTDEIYKMIREWQSGLYTLQPWKVIPAAMIIKEWQYNYKTGLNHENVIFKMQEIVINAYVRLEINNILSGHTTYDPYYYLSDYELIPDGINQDNFDNWIDSFYDFIQNRISDYGIDKIGNGILSLLTTDDLKEKMYYIDQILSVSHQRFDLAMCFVEDGTRTLNAIFEMTPAL